MEEFGVWKFTSRRLFCTWKIKRSVSRKLGLVSLMKVFASWRPKKQSLGKATQEWSRRKRETFHPYCCYMLCDCMQKLFFYFMLWVPRRPLGFSSRKRKCKRFVFLPNMANVLYDALSKDTTRILPLKPLLSTSKFVLTWLISAREKHTVPSTLAGGKGKHYSSAQCKKSLIYWLLCIHDT